MLLQAVGFGGTPALAGAPSVFAYQPFWVPASGVWAGTPACSLCWLAGQPGWDALVLNFVFLTPRLKGKNT